MKVVILAGGLGTRLSEETAIRPKPMVEIGGRPILWHIMKLYAHQGFNEFVICLGYKGYVIKEYFANYFLHMCDVTFDLASNALEVHQSQSEPWKVTLVDTGEATATGGRIKRVARYLDGDQFMLTYGDGVADVDLPALLAFHAKEGALATVTGVQPPGRFGALRIDGHRATGFQEKPSGDGGWINGGFFVVNRKAIDYIDGDQTVWENEPMERLARERQLAVHLHKGFWQPMDTLRDRSQLEAMWQAGQAPWKKWG
jgi:glucose-1-phosphate cytidylyltransferase